MAGNEESYTDALALTTTNAAATVDEEEEEGSESDKRPTWGHKVDFILSCVGFAVGFGNVWRFPYLCYRNGGGAFLIPYFIFLVAGGVPVFFLEIFLGQFMSQGGIGCWKICPILQGIGFATTVICFLGNIYYIIILNWAAYFFGRSFTSLLPWSHCDNQWNTEYCTTNFTKPDTGAMNMTNATMDGNMTAFNTTNATLQISPVVEFWENKVLNMSEGVGELGEVQWDLAVCLLCVWIVVYFCVFKGVKSTGKVVYFTATFPYVMLTVLLIRGVTLDGAADGLFFYLNPDLERLKDHKVWIDAGTQIFFSFAIGVGCMTALGSYNKFHNDSYKQCFLIAAVNCFTSLYSGLVVFSVLGFMANEQGLDIKDVAASGPGLVFIAYPRALSLMPLAPLWSCLFFFMIILVGLDSEFVGVEGVVTAVVDMIPYLRRGYNRELFIAGMCVFNFLLGLTMVTNGGIYVFKLFEYYSASGIALLFMAFSECVAIAWIFGVNRFYDSIELMVGYRPLVWFKICWTVLTPLIIVGIILFMCVTWSPMEFQHFTGTYYFPTWAEGIGWVMMAMSIICVPVTAVVKMWQAKGTLRERWREVTTPQLQYHQLRDKDKLARGLRFDSDPSTHPPPYSSLQQHDTEL
uniref:Transporter n=1 Tax=Branchiostoma floridae TaxID=7739 RepID=C3YAH1_BRAFL|eukprot:XP_002606709.1 solute carrier family 6, member 8 [Branchiostoma floridae]